MNNEQLKKEFINSFGEEQWNIEEALTKLEKQSKHLSKLLNVKELIIVSDNLYEDSRIMFKEEYIILRKDIALNYVEALKAIAHEYRHFYQYTCVKENRTNEPLLEFYIDDFNKINKDGYKPLEPDKYFSLIIELDAFAFQKYYLKKELGIETHHPDDVYDHLLDKFIEKFY